MDVFTINRLKITDALYNSFFTGGVNSAYYNTLTDSSKRNYRHLLQLFIIQNGKLYIEIKSKSAGLRKRRVEFVAPAQREGVLQQLYSNPETTKNGRDSFYTRILESYAGISRRYVQSWLEKQENYQLHLHQPREKILRPIADKTINSRWQLDLVDLQKYKSPQNHQRGWLFVAIDVFSKFAYVKAITQKTAVKVGQAFEAILTENYGRTSGYPNVIQTDNGKEFLNKIIKRICEQKSIKHITNLPYLPQANAVVERFNRTIKRAIFSQFTVNGNTRFFNILDEVVKNYNNTIHSALKATPAKIHNANKSSARQVKLFEERRKTWIKNERTYKALSRGDLVRIHILTDKEARKKRIFSKKFLPQWSKAIYRIVSIKGSKTPEDQLRTRKTYKLKKVIDDNGQRVDGEVLSKGFYRHDLQKIVL